MGVHVRFVCVSFLSFGEKKKNFFVAVEKLKKKGERDFYAKTPLEQKSIKRTSVFFLARERATPIVAARFLGHRQIWPQTDRS